jgi:hypothetical protein
LTGTQQQQPLQQTNNINNLLQSNVGGANTEGGGAGPFNNEQLSNTLNKNNQQQTRNAIGGSSVISKLQQQKLGQQQLDSSYKSRDQSSNINNIKVSESKKAITGNPNSKQLVNSQMKKRVRHLDNKFKTCLHVFADRSSRWTNEY